MKTFTTFNTFEDIRNGDNMSQEEFHTLYEQKPDCFRAELLAGTVYVCEPLSEFHADIHTELAALFGAYRAYTPGVQALIDATVILGESDEVQPDMTLRVLPEYQGQTSDYIYKKGRKASGPYIKGAPELVAEISFSSRSMDLHVKRKRYEQAGVLEYLVISLQDEELFWFDLANGTSIKPSKGIFKSRIFPGLWIHKSALFGMRYELMMDTVQRGLSSAEHKSFLSHLRELRANKKPSN
ncbi:MAG: Uma2 family endonuclease [Candidatus Obscuribacterales bacterium]|jgi:Uma2 family endonuclease|nr:Uma2 family endonuclease [Candidatus Obscuribacterales bacterium]